MPKITDMLFKLRPADVVTIIFLLFLSGLTLIFHESLPRAPFLLSLYSLLFIVQILSIKFKNNGKFSGLFYDIIFPVVCVLLIFDSLEWLVHYINPEDMDPLLIKLDYMIFGAHPTVALERIMNPVLTDILQIAYTTYYFIPIGFGVVLLINDQRKDFEKSLFMILFCFYLSYLGYILFPALGPRFYIDHLQTVELRGFIIAEPIQELLNRIEGIKRDAFPSGHTAVTLTVLYLAYKVRRRFFRITLPLVTGLVFATVYCRYHYVVDVLAGFVLTIITIVLGEWYYGQWLKRQDVNRICE